MYPSRSRHQLLFILKEGEDRLASEGVIKESERNDHIKLNMGKGHFISL